MRSAFIACLLLTSLGFSQSASEPVSAGPQTRIAAVTRKDVNVFKGRLIRQDENAVVLESDGMTLSIPMDSVANINLGSWGRTKQDPHRMDEAGDLDAFYWG